MQRFLCKLNRYGYKPSAKTTGFIEQQNKYSCRNDNKLDIVISKADGNYLWDVDNVRYLDCTSSHNTINLGHNYKRFNQIIEEYLDELTLTSRAVYNDKLGETCRHLTHFFGYDKSIMTNGEAETGETAIKFARRWAYLKKGIKDNQAKVLFAKGNYWGSTIAGCASSDDPNIHGGFGPYGNMGFKTIPYNNIPALEEELIADPNIAAFMLEPIQAEAGVIVPDAGYLQQVRTLCTKYNVLMILDEVQTGVCRTGKMLCQDHEEVKADIVCLGGAIASGYLPVSAVLGTHDVFECITPGTHGSTYGGNPLASEMTKATLRAISMEGVAETSARLGIRIIRKLTKDLGTNRMIKAVRGKGLLIGVEFEDSVMERFDHIFSDILKEGMLCEWPKNNTLVISPPLILNGNEADYICDTLTYVISQHS